MQIYRPEKFIDF